MELIEKFLVGIEDQDPASASASSYSHETDSTNDFSMEFNDFLHDHADSIPRNVEHSFFVWFFLGSLFNLPDSGLMSKIGIKDLEVLCSENHIGVAFVREIHDELYFNFRSIVLPRHDKKSKTETIFDHSELKELALKWHFDFYQLSNMNLDVRRLHIKMFEDQKKFAKTRFEATYEICDTTSVGDSLVMIAKEITSQEILNKRIKLSTSDTKFVTLTENLESKIKFLSEAMETLSTGSVEQLKVGVLTQLMGFHNSLKSYQDTAKMPLEAESSVAFMAGGYLMNYQKRYQLLCEIHRIPARDTLLLSVLSRVQSSDLYKGNIPVIFTSDMDDPATKSLFLRKEGIRETLPSFLTDSSVGLLVVADHELELGKQPFGMNTVPINQGIFFKFLTAHDHLPKEKSFYKDFLAKGLENLAFKVGTTSPTSISCFTFGQLLALQTAEAEKYFFIYADPIMQQEVKTFLISKEEHLIAVHIVGEQLEAARMENFFKGNLLNVYDKRHKDVININLIVDSLRGWKIDVNDVYGHERFLGLSPVFHEGKMLPISTIEPINFFSRMMVKDLDKVTKSLINAVKDHRTLIQDEFHMKALLKGLFSPCLMILSNLESRNRQMLGLVAQTHIRHVSLDLSLKDMLEMPALTGNALMDNNPLLLRLSSTYQLMDDEQGRLNIIDKHIVNLWSDYYKSLNFPNKYAKPVLGALIWNGNREENEHLITGASWKLTDEMSKVLKSIKDASCSRLRIKRRDVACLNDENFKSLLETTENSVKISSQKFVELAQKDPQKAEFMLNALNQHVNKNFKVIGDRSQTLDAALRQSKLTTKLQRLGAYANLGTVALIAKDIVASLSQGRYGAAVSTTAFLAANIALGMAPSAITKLANGLGLRGYKSVGWALKSVAPFTGKLASAYVLYDLVKNVKAKSGPDSGMAVANIIADGAFLFIDVVDLGIAIGERFALIEGASTVFGPVGSLVGALVFVGANVYSAYHTVRNLDDIVKLTPAERIVEGLRNFVGMEPEQYLKDLVERKEHFERMVESALEFLNNGTNSNFDSYFMPTMRTRLTNQWEDEPNNCIDFGLKVAWANMPRDTPDNPDQGKVLCFDTGTARGVSESLESFSYYCNNAMGVTKNKGNPLKSVLFDLRGGNDCVQAAALNGSNLFLIGDGTKSIRSSAGSDHFLFMGNLTLGSIEGRVGKHILDLSVYAVNSSKVVTDLSMAKSYIKNQGEYFYIEGMSKVIGRSKGQDEIYPSCRTTYVDSGHGKCKKNKDLVKILNRMCIYNMTIKVQNRVDIVNKALYGIFTYYIQTTADQSIVYITRRSKAVHRFIFNATINDIVQIKVYNSKKGKQLLFKFKKYSLAVRCYQTNCNYYFRDGIYMKVERNRENIHYHAYLDTDMEPEDVMTLYVPTADRLAISFTVRCKRHASTVFISHKSALKVSKLPGQLHGSNVVQNDPKSMTYIYGACDTENLFIVRSGKKILNNFLDASIGPIFIYEDQAAAQHTRTLVLVELTDQLKNDLNADLRVKVVRDHLADNLLFEILAVDEHQQEHSLTHIRFYESFFLDLYHKLQIIIKDVPHHVIHDLSTGETFLRPMPRVDLNNETEFLLLHEENLPYNFTEFYIPKNVMNDFDTFRTANKSLILLEKRDNDQTAAHPLFCILMMDYFDKYNNSTLKTAKFSFKNSTIDLKDLKPEYDQLMSFENYLQVHQSVLRQHLDQLLDHHDSK